MCTARVWTGNRESGRNAELVHPGQIIQPRVVKETLLRVRMATCNGEMVNYPVT